MDGRINVAGNSPYEAVVGYSRAVRSGDLVYISGTTATSADGTLVGVGDAYAQARQALKNIEQALLAVGAGLSDVVRTRMYVVDMGDAMAIARAHQEAFGDVRPAATMVQVAALIDPAMLVEVEVDAHLRHGG